ncbi:MAG: complex I intermediate-associated protein 30-domain-containing protein [Monoraphidium minutum]|nr:MAG: complex I intermediate-associated protein 30-domain-containing protein [Monoraphidium minutum]
MQLSRHAHALAAPPSAAAPQRAAARALTPRRRVALAPRGAPPRRGGAAVARAGWDLGRFAKTVLFFNDPAKLIAGLFSGGQAGAPEGAIQTLARGPPAPAGAQDLGVVMVTGATGGVGKRVVQLLLARGRRVRALARDAPKARELLGSLQPAAGGVLELVTADIAQRRTLLPAYFEGVRQLVSCSAVKVVPKEGDTVDRAKYYQGIKFFDPEIVGDTPQAVEHTGMINVLDALKEHLGTAPGAALLAPEPALAARWGALDDVVMGGVSESGLALVPGAGEGGAPALVFRGTVSTDNNGGFASVRCRNWEPALDLGAYAGLRLRLRGNGLRYKLIVRTDSGWDGIGYTASFDTADGWQTVDVPFSSFVPVFRARTVTGPDAKPLDPSSVYSLQIMLSKFEYDVGFRWCSGSGADGVLGRLWMPPVQIMLSKFEYDGKLNPSFKAGPFQLPIADVSAYLASPVTPRVVHVSSAGVTRPNRPGINVDMEPPAVKLNDALGGLLTWKLAGEDALRGSGVPAAVVRPCALTEEAGRMPIEIDQGDVIKGKISRDDVAELCVALLDAPAAAGATFEIKSTVPFSQPWGEADREQQPPRDWRAAIEAAGLAPGVTGKTVGGVYSGKRPEAEVAAEYGEAAYWDERYAREPICFDWYQGWAGLEGVIRRHLRPDEPLLHVGVGTSRLQEGLVTEGGFVRVVNLDVSTVVVDQMARLHAGVAELEYAAGDVRSMPQYEDGSFGGVLDKGTLDAILCGAAPAENAAAALAECCRVEPRGRGAGGVLDKGTLDAILCGAAPADNAAAALAECCRVLKPGGVFMLVTYGDPECRLGHLTAGLPWDVQAYVLSKPDAASAAAAEGGAPPRAVLQGPFDARDKGWRFTLAAGIAEEGCVFSTCVSVPATATKSPRAVLQGPFDARDKVRGGPTEKIDHHYP